MQVYKVGPLADWAQDYPRCFTPLALQECVPDMGGVMWPVCHEHCLLRLQLQDISLSLTAFDRRPSPCQPRTHRRHTLLHGVHVVAERCSVDRCYVCRTSDKRKFKSVMPDYVIRCFQLAHKGGFSTY